MAVNRENENFEYPQKVTLECGQATMVCEVQVLKIALLPIVSSRQIVVCGSSKFLASNAVHPFRVASKPDFVLYTANFAVLALI